MVLVPAAGPVVVVVGPTVESFWMTPAMMVAMVEAVGPGASARAAVPGAVVAMITTISSNMSMARAEREGTVAFSVETEATGPADPAVGVA